MWRKWVYENDRSLVTRVSVQMRSGSPCGPDGSTVASDTRGPGFESSHTANLIEQLITVCRNDGNNKKRPVWLILE